MSSRLHHLIACSVGVSFALVLVSSGWSATTTMGISGCFANTIESPSPMQDQLEPFLERLQLPRLRIRLLEQLLVKRTQELQGGGAGEVERQAELEPLAKRLLRLYAQQLMQPTDGEGEWLRETEMLLKSYPNIATSSVRVAVMQAAYQQNEFAFRQWRTDGAPLEQASQQLERWRELVQTLDQIQAELQRDYDDQLVVIQSLGRTTTELNDRLTQVESQLAHTEYLLGWGRYFLGVLDGRNRNEQLLKADSHFREFLQIDQQQSLEQLDAKWIDWRSSWNLRAVAGWAMTQRGLDRPDASEKCFQMIARQAERIDAVYIWRFNSRIYINDYVGLDKLISEFHADQRVSASGRARFWLALADASQAIQGRANKVARSLRRAAIAGLATEFQASLLRDVVEGGQAPWDGVEDLFLRNWVEGYLLFDVVDVARQPAEYEAAERKLQAALKLVGDPAAETKMPTRPAEVLACRFVLAQIKLAQNELSTATRELLQLTEELASHNRQLAMQSHWLAIGAIAKQSQLDRFRSVDAIQEIDRFRRRFPGSEFDAKAELLRMKLVAVNLSAEQAIERWAALPIGHVHADEGMLEIARLRLGQWLDAKPNGALRQQRWDDFQDAIANAVKSSQDDRSLLLKLRLLQARALAINEKSDIVELRGVLDKVREQLSRRSAVRDDVLAAAEVSSYEVVAALRVEDLEAAQKALAWLNENAPQSRYRRNSLISIAGAVDKRALADQDPALQQKAVQIFESLVAMFCDGEAVIPEQRLRDSANARVACTRLAYWYLRTDRANQALPLVQRLVALFPKRKAYVQLLTQAFMATGEYEAAIRHWRDLASASAVGTESWWEAKLGVAVGLSEAGEIESAIQLIRQTELLSPEVPLTVKSRWGATASKLGIRK